MNTQENPRDIRPEWRPEWRPDIRPEWRPERRTERRARVSRLRLLALTLMFTVIFALIFAPVFAPIFAPVSPRFGPSSVAADVGDDNGASDTSDARPAAIIRSIVDQVFVILRDPALQPREQRNRRIEAIRRVADQVFDWRLMAQRSLGVHWRSLDDAQRDHFLALFKDLLSDRYMDDMDRFRGTEQVIVHGEKQLGERIEVETTLITHSRERVPIHYFMYRNDGERGWLVDDISIEGVSLVNHYRTTFHRFLVNRSFEQLIQRLESKHGPDDNKSR